MDKYVALIKKCFDSFSGFDFSTDEIKKAMSDCVIMHYLPDEYFLRMGEMSSKIGFITEGLFRIFHTDIKGNEYTKNFKSSGQFVSSLAALLLASPSKLSIQALENSELICIHYDNILKLADKNLQWQILLRKNIEADYLEKEKRESDLLYYDAKERYLHFIYEHPDWDARIQQRFIASYLGMTAETLSRIRSKPVSNPVKKYQN